MRSTTTWSSISPDSKRRVWKQTRRLANSPGVRPGAAGETGPIKKQTPLQRESRANKKVPGFDAPTMTPAAFQSGSLDRWLAAELYGEDADIGLNGVERGSSSARKPRLVGKRPHSHGQRYSLASDRVDSSFP